MNSQTKVTKETRNKIKADFDRAPLKERLKAKYLNSFFYKKFSATFSDSFFFSVSLT
jgi:hypothetical protein